MDPGGSPERTPRAILPPVTDRPADVPWRPGQRLDEYELVRRLGAGSQGEVWEAREPALGRRVALKVLSVARLDGREAARFRREAESCARLSHPGIAAVHRLIGHGDRLVLVQECLDGGSLAQRLEAGVPHGLAGAEAPRRAARMACDLARALAHAHERGVVHRDVKPGNVLFRADGSVALVDFGLARLADGPALSATSATLGTPYYMSPEQVRGQPVDGRADVWGLGATLYETLTGQPPFPGDSVAAVLLDIVTRAPRPPRALQPAVPEDLEAVCLRCLARDPRERYASAAELAEDLERFLAGEPTRARPAGPWRRARAALQRVPAAAYPPLAALVAAGWLIADRLLLRELSLRRLDGHVPRLALLGLAAGLLGWASWRWLERLVAGRHRGPWLAWPLAAALALPPAAGILHDRDALRHRVARSELEQAWLLDPERAFRELDAWSATQADHLDGDDFRLLARIALSGDALGRTEAWLTRWTQVAPSDPVAWSMLATLHWLLGRDAESAAAEARAELARAAGCSSEQWRRMGQFQVEAGRVGLALQCFDRAARLPDADRDLLDLSLTEARITLCQPEEALESLSAYRRFHDDTPTRRLALKVALLRLRGGDGSQELLAQARELLAAIEADPLTPRHVVFEDALELAAAADGAPGRSALLDAWRGRTGDDLDLTFHVARACYGSATPEGLRTAAEMFTGLVETAGERGRPDLQAMALANLSAVAFMEEDYDRAAELARRAIDLDGGSWSAWSNHASARGRQLAAAHGPEESWPPEAWAELARLWERTGECHGRQPKVLNNIAYCLARLSQATGRAADVGRARLAADRAVRLNRGDPLSSCGLDDARRSQMVKALKTRFLILRELQDDDAAALADAHELVSLLPAGHPDRAEYERAVAELEALLSSR